MKLIFVCFAVILCSIKITGVPVIEGELTGVTIKGKDGSKIVTGRELYPYMAYLEIRDKEWNSVNFCGGTLVSPRVVLTAAHCLTGNSGNIEIYAIAGILHLEAERNNAQIIKMYDYSIHNKYSRLAVESNKGVEYGTSFNNDIALIWTIRRFTYGPKVSHIEVMSPNAALEGRTGFILGWGQTERGTCATMLRRADLRVIPRSKCEYSRSGRKYILNHGMLCTLSDTKTKQQCKGDSGGPFILNGKVAGVISYSFKSEVTLPNGNKVEMSITEYGGVVSNVKYFHDWIINNIKQGPPRDRQKPQQKPQQKPRLKPTSSTGSRRNSA